MLVVMKTTVQLDYQAIVANQAQPVHLAFQLTAPAHAGRRYHPHASLPKLRR
jgi:hypothetical protein